MISMAVSSLDVCNYAYSGQVDSIKILLDQDKTTLNVKDSNKRTALHWACSAGQTEITALLINSGANVS